MRRAGSVGCDEVPAARLRGIADEQATIRRHLIVRGRVQGVFFRDSTRERANAQGVAGWISNRPDGAVEAVLEGPADGVEQLLEFLSTGPPQAHVDQVDVREEPPEGLTGFNVR